MVEDRGAPRPVAWYDLFPALILLTSVRLAVNFRALLLAALGLAATIAGWRIAGDIFDRADAQSVRREPADSKGEYLYYPWYWIEITEPSPFDDLRHWPTGEFGGEALSQRPGISTGASSWWYTSPLVNAWTYLTAPFVRMFQPPTSLAYFTEMAVCALWALVVWAFFGGAISRLAAVGLAREEQPSWGRLLAYARSKWASYFAAPLFPLLGVLLTGLVLALFGLLLRADLGVVVAAILWPLVLLAGLFMAILAVGLFFGWPLMWATVSTEGTDSFDALSRSYAYSYQRPLHYFFYALVAIILGSLGWIVVSIFATQVIRLSLWGVAWGATDGRVADVLANKNLNDVGEFGATLIRFWSRCVVMLTLGFVFSYFWTSVTAIYFLLRRHVDATELDEVYLTDEEEAGSLERQPEMSAVGPAAATAGDQSAAPF